jgi:hypothetical protein
VYFHDVRTGEHIFGPTFEPSADVPGNPVVTLISDNGEVLGVSNSGMVPDIDGNISFIWNPHNSDFQYLPALPGFDSPVPYLSSDDGNQIFGRVNTGSGRGTWVEWTRVDETWSVSTDVPWLLPTGARDMWVRGYNKAGFSVGYLVLTSGGPAASEGVCVKAVIWSPTGELSDLGLGCESYALAINDLNQVVVEKGHNTCCDNDSYKALVVDTSTGEIRDVGKFADTVGMNGISINNLGQVVGVSGNREGKVDGFFWEPTTGKLVKLKIESENVFASKARQTMPLHISDDGLIVGIGWRDTWSVDGAPIERSAFFWDLNEAQSLPVLSIGDVEIVEGDSGRCRYASFPVTLSSPAHSAVTAKFSVISGQGATGAAAGTDFTSLSGTIRFTPRSNGETATQQKINICIKSDSVAEGDQEFKVELADVFGGAVPGSIIGTGTIIDDDDNPSALPSFSVGDVTVEEGDLSLGKSRVLRVPVTLSRPAATRISVEVAIVSSSAEALVDFTLPRITMVVTFEPNQVSKFVSIAVLPDFFAEGDESFLVRLSNASAVAAIDREQGAVTIQNDD